MKRIVLGLIIAVSCVTMLAQTPKVVSDDKGGWHKMGETKVDFKRKTDKIAIVGTNLFSSLKIKVKAAPIRLESFDVYYENGERQTVDIKKEFKQAGETRVVTLGGERNIEKVEFKYKNVGNLSDKKARVELWGYK